MPRSLARCWKRERNSGLISSPSDVTVWRSTGMSSALTKRRSDSLNIRSSSGSWKSITQAPPLALFVPANPRLREDRRGDPACSSVLGTNPAAVVPAQAGTHNHQDFDYRWPCHIALLRRMGPRLRGDDSGESLLHILRKRGRTVEWRGHRLARD